MYRNSNSPEQQQAPRPAPEPSGRELARFLRPGRGRKPNAVLRLALDTFEGHDYLSVRVWEQSPVGLLPSKAGCSIRLVEAEDVAAALLEGVRLAHAPAARLKPAGAAQGSRVRGASQRRERSPAARTSARRDPEPTLFAGPPPETSTAFSTDFDEFAGS